MILSLILRLLPDKTRATSEKGNTMLSPDLGNVPDLGDAGIYSTIWSCDPPVSESAPRAAPWLRAWLMVMGNTDQAKHAMCSDEDLRIPPQTFSFNALLFYSLWPPKSQRHLPLIPQASSRAMHRAGHKCSSTNKRFSSVTSFVCVLSVKIPEGRGCVLPSLTVLCSAHRDVLLAVDL